MLTKCNAVLLLTNFTSTSALTHPFQVHLAFNSTLCIPFPFTSDHLLPLQFVRTLSLLTDCCYLAPRTSDIPLTPSPSLLWPAAGIPFQPLQPILFVQPHLRATLIRPFGNILRFLPLSTLHVACRYDSFTPAVGALAYTRQSIIQRK